MSIWASADDVAHAAMRRYDDTRGSELDIDVATSGITDQIRIACGLHDKQYNLWTVLLSQDEAEQLGHMLLAAAYKDRPTP